MAEETKQPKKPQVEESKEMKFTDEELQSLQGLQNNYQEKQVILGQLAVQRILLNQQLEVLIFVLKKLKRNIKQFNKKNKILLKL